MKRCLILKVLERGHSKEGTPKGVWGCSSAGRAPALQAGGQEFDPPHLHQTFLETGKVEGKWVKRDAGRKSHGLIAQVVRAHA